MSDEATIGTVAWDGAEYEIDWPERLDVPGQREDYGVIYQDGRTLAEFTMPFGDAWETRQDVLDSAFAFIAEGGLDG